jgi:hypothetical protein
MEALERPVRRLRSAAPPTAEAVAALRADPRFPEAFGAMIRDLVALYHGHRILSQVLNDRGRVVFGMLAMYLHFSPDCGGLTVGAMRELCVETGLCSPGRATAMLSLMRFAGYIAPAPHAFDRRVRLFVPTARLIGDHAQRMRGQFAAMAPLMPEGAAGLAHIDDQEFLAEMACCFGEEFRAGFRLLERSPELFPLAERNAGIIILMSLLLAREEDDTMPPVRPVAISISALAHHCGVSRPHILKLLRDAKASGFIDIIGAESQRIVILPRLAEALLNFIATTFVFVAYCVRTALARIEGARAAG